MKPLDITIIRSPDVFLVTSQEEFNAVLAGMENPLAPHNYGDWLGPGHAACVHTLTHTSRITCVVAVDTTNDPLYVTQCLVHESVHVFQRLCESINETSPGVEIQAYGVEHIFAALQEELARRQKEQPHAAHQHETQSSDSASAKPGADQARHPPREGV